ncbi:MAG: hypothetical protein GY811_06500 [Myxococcales bacterium]|nr:hypothetical protein [Myxococcales bacterium]
MSSVSTSGIKRFVMLISAITAFPVVLSLLIPPLGHEGVAYAQEPGLLLQLDTEYRRTNDPTAIGGLRDTQTVGLSIDANGRIGRGHVAHSALIDAHFGAGMQGGGAPIALPFFLSVSPYRMRGST